MPGVVEVPELALHLRVEQAAVGPWLFEVSARRAGLSFPAGAPVVVRNRRPGDRFRPLGCPWERRLKEVLIDRKIPRRNRDGLPLLCVGGDIAWVPGVGIAEPFRVPRGSDRAWKVEIEES